MGQFRMRNGAIVKVPVKLARLLERSGRGYYMTRDMRAVEPPIVVQSDEDEVIDVAKMRKRDLRELAEARGIEVEPGTSVAELRALLDS